MKKLVFLTLVVLFSLSLQAKKVEIEVNLLNNSYAQVVVIDVDENKTLSIEDIKNNKFKTSIDIQKQKIVAFQFARNINMYVFLSPEDDNVKITYDFQNPQNWTVKGSKCTNLYFETMKKLAQVTTQDQRITLFKDVVNNNPGCLASVVFAMSLIDVPNTQDMHEKFIASLNDLKDNPLVNQYISDYEKSKITAIGSIAPEIALPDTNGNIVKLSSLRGQYVLVDFWAAWCRPCRFESPNLVAAYEKYHDKGFTIYSVSLDQSKDSWLKAIHKDGLQKWTHVSDLKYWNSEAAATYGVNAIPANFLLDPEGRIIAKNLRGTKLEQKLQEIFDKK